MIDALLTGKYGPNEKSMTIVHVADLMKESYSFSAVEVVRYIKLSHAYRFEFTS